MTLSKKQQWQRLVRAIKVGIERLADPPFIRNYNRSFRQRYIKYQKEGGQLGYRDWFTNTISYDEISKGVNQLNNI